VIIRVQGEANRQVTALVGYKHTNGQDEQASVALVQQAESPVVYRVFSILQIIYLS